MNDISSAEKSIVLTPKIESFRDGMDTLERKLLGPRRSLQSLKSFENRARAIASLNPAEVKVQTLQSYAPFGQLNESVQVAMEKTIDNVIARQQGMQEWWDKGVDIQDVVSAFTPPENMNDLRDNLELAKISLIPGGVAIVTSPELFSKLVVKELETKEGIVIDAGEVTSKLSKSAEVGFLVSPEALHKGHTLPADIKITVVQNTTGMISALQHEVYSEMAGELIAEGTKTTETLKRLQESHPVSAFLKRALFDLSARLEENGRVENFGDLSVTEEMKKKHPDDADIKPK